MTRATAVAVTDGERTKRFNQEEFLRVLRSGELVAVVAFYRTIEPLTDERTRFHCRGILRELAGAHFRDCRGVAYSPEHAECFRFCGLEPLRIARAGTTQ